MRGEHLVDAALEFSVVGSFSRIGYAVRSRLTGWETPAGLAGTRVLLTGGTSGVGLAAARTLTTLGAHVAITGRSQERLDGAADQIAAHGRGPITVVADSADLAAVRAMFDATVAGLGGLDVVVNNAGALTHEYTRSPQGFETTYAVHVLAPFLLTQLAVPVVGPQGRVITVSSGGMYSQSLRPDMQCGPEGFDGVAAYAKAKRAQVALTQEWAAGTPEDRRSPPCIPAGPTPPACAPRCRRSGGSPDRSCAPLSKVLTPWSGWPRPKCTAAGSGSTGAAGRSCVCPGPATPRTTRRPSSIGSPSRCRLPTPRSRRSPSQGVRTGDYAGESWCRPASTCSRPVPLAVA